MKYDYFIAGRWRNRDEIKKVVEKLRSAGKAVYCFIENEYDGHGIVQKTDPNHDIEAMMKTSESLKDWRTNPTFRKIFETDMEALKNSSALIAVFPFGFSAHMELGVAYGSGKKCIGIGSPEKAETLYFMFEKIYPTVGEFINSEHLA